MPPRRAPARQRLAASPRVQYSAPASPEKKRKDSPDNNYYQHQQRHTGKKNIKNYHFIGKDRRRGARGKKAHYRDILPEFFRRRRRMLRRKTKREECEKYDSHSRQAGRGRRWRPPAALTACLLSLPRSNPCLCSGRAERRHHVLRRSCWLGTRSLRGADTAPPHPTPRS